MVGQSPGAVFAASWQPWANRRLARAGSDVRVTDARCWTPDHTYFYCHFRANGGCWRLTIDLDYALWGGIVPERCP